MDVSRLSDALAYTARAVIGLLCALPNPAALWVYDRILIFVFPTAVVLTGTLLLVLLICVEWWVGRPGIRAKSE